MDEVKVEMYVTFALHPQDRKFTAIVRGVRNPKLAAAEVNRFCMQKNFALPRTLQMEEQWMMGTGDKVWILTGDFR